ncbi:MAG: DUF362 domain-containing protein [Proteobacteria bacterium]|nr:DUF362 domain-containing protein [Pseudomonadota bacterium]
MTKSNRPPKGRIIRSKDLLQEFREKELNRRQFIARASTATAAGVLVPGCGPVGDDDDSVDEVINSLVGMGGGEGYKTALSAAMNETIARDGLAEVVNSGDVVFLKVNSNSGDPYPYSTRPRMIEELTAWCLDQGASRVIVGDRSFFGDPNTYGNLVANGAVEAAANAGAELLVLDEDDPDIDWVMVTEDDAPDWQGGFRFPTPVVEADVIFNLPIVKTHFISQFTMGMKNIIGLAHPADRARDANLAYHPTNDNKLYKMIAQLNQHVTPTLTFLDGWEAVVRGGPTIGGNPSGLEDSPGVHIVSADRIAADVTGLAVLKQFAVESERVHDTDVWDNPQIEEAVNAGVGISGPDEYNAAGPTVADFETYMNEILG